MIPPEIRQKDEITSVGGRDGKKEDGGEMYVITYVNARATEKPTRRVPHCLWIMVLIAESWWCAPIKQPRSRIIKAGKGFNEKE